MIRAWIVANFLGRLYSQAIPLGGLLFQEVQYVAARLQLSGALACTIIAFVAASLNQATRDHARVTFDNDTLGITLMESRHRYTRRQQPLRTFEEHERHRHAV